MPQILLLLKQEFPSLTVTNVIEIYRKNNNLCIHIDIAVPKENVRKKGTENI